VFAGLDAQTRYRVRREPLPGEGSDAHGPIVHEGASDVVAGGSLLMHAGIEAPTLRPEQAVLYHLLAEA
jgi:hypothetical protein